jgi:hypothetical protein
MDLVSEIFEALFQGYFWFGLFVGFFAGALVVVKYGDRN